MTASPLEFATAFVESCAIYSAVLSLLLHFRSRHKRVMRQVTLSCEEMSARPRSSAVDHALKLKWDMGSGIVGTVST